MDLCERIIGSWKKKTEEIDMDKNLLRAEKDPLMQMSSDEV